MNTMNGVVCIFIHVFLSEYMLLFSQECDRSCDYLMLKTSVSKYKFCRILKSKQSKAKKTPKQKIIPRNNLKHIIYYSNLT